MSHQIIVFPFVSDDEVKPTSKELVDFATQVRNATLCEVLSTVTDKLNPNGNTQTEFALIGVLKAVNDMRTPEPEEGKK